MTSSTASSTVATAICSLPAGYRTLTPSEGDALTYGQPVRLLDRRTGDVLTGVVHGQTDEYVRVTVAISRAELAFDRDEDHFWPDDRTEPRRPPQTSDGQFVLVAPKYEDLA